MGKELPTGSNKKQVGQAFLKESLSHFYMDQKEMESESKLNEWTLDCNFLPEIRAQLKADTEMRL